MGKMKVTYELKLCLLDRKRVASKDSPSTPSTTTPAAGTIGSVDNSLGSSSSHDSDDASDSMPRNSEFFEEVKDLSEDDN